MNSKHTLAWFVIAVALCAFIGGYRFLEHSTVIPSAEVLPGLHLPSVTSVQVSPKNMPEISVERTNDDWVLTQPVSYPAQNAAVDALLNDLKNLKSVIRITPAELSQNHDANAEYGFDSPSFSLVIQSGDDRREILVGNRTAPGDQVFLRVEGVEGVFVTGTDWLKLIPETANDWRDTSLVSSKDTFDSITLTNSAKITAQNSSVIIELHCDPVTHLWKMTHPLIARANGDYIANALQQLQTARVSQFVSDDANPELTSFGLQPATLDLWLGHGSNFVSALHFGNISPSDSTQIFAKREGWNAIMTTAKQPLSPWFRVVNDFRDPYLLELTAPVAEIEMVGPGTNDFSIQRNETNGWQIAGQTFPVDADNVQSLIQLLAGLRVSEFVKEVVTPADLPTYGLAKPARQIILRSAIGDTNAVIAQLLFGTNQANEVFVQRADEGLFVYGITPEDFAAVMTDNGPVPDGQPWQFRDRRIWNFTENDVTQITVRQNGKVEQMVHKGPNQWSLTAGQGIIVPPAIEEVAHDLGNMAAVAWLARGASDPPGYGLKPDNLSITIAYKGQSVRVDFGAPVSSQTACAAVTLDGQRWVFIFPPGVYQLVQSYLAISRDVP